MTFPDLVPELRARMPGLRGRLIANQPLAELTWFRVGGPAQVLFSPQDTEDFAALLAELPAEVPVTVDRPRLQSHRARRRGRRRGDPARPRLRRDRRRGRLPRARRHRGARREGGARRPGGRNRRPVVPARHTRLDRRRAAHEWRRLWRRDQGRAGRGARRRPRRPHRALRQCGHALQLPPLRRPRRRDLHRGGIPGRAAAIPP